MKKDNELIILLVEDSVSDAALLQESILMNSQNGVLVTIAQSLHAAIEYCDKNQIDATLLDLTLPDSSGLDTVRALRDACPRTPIVVLTGVDDERIGIEAVRLGVQDYLVKGQTDGRFLLRTIRYSIERKQAEEQLRESNRKIANVLNSITDAYFALDSEWQFIELNPIAEAEIFGKNASELKGKVFWDIYPRSIDSDFYRQCHRAVNENHPVHFEEQSKIIDKWFESHAYPRNGRLEIYLRDITERKLMEQELRDANDRLEAKVRERTTELADAVVMLQDEMEEREKMQKALLESEIKYRELVENASSIIMRRDAGGKITFLNEFGQKFFGFSEREIIGRNIIGTILPRVDSSGKDMELVIREIIKRPELYQNHESENTCKNGRKAWISWTNKPINDEKGTVLEILSVGNDITFHKQADAKIREYETQLRSLTTELLLTEEQERHKVAETLHDSIGPLLAFSERELGNLEKFAPKEITLSLQEVKKHIGTAMKQTRNLTFDLSPSSLYDLGFEAAVEELVEQFTREHKLKYCFKDSEESKPLTDEVKILLYRSVRELLINTAKHAKATAVRVNIATKDSKIEIMVKDNGKGFDSEKKSKGFGLFSIRERLTHIGGQFVIESQKDKGTKIILVAPLKVSKK